MAIVTTLTVSSVFSNMPAFVYAQENENAENLVEGDRNDSNQITNNETASPTANNSLSGDCGATENDNVTWELRQNNSDNNNPTYTLIISGNGDMKDEYRPYDDKKQQITEIFIGNGVSKIGKGAFWNSKNVVKVTFEEQSSLQVIGKNAFHTNISLTSVVLPASLTIIEDSVFYGDTNLQIVEFENADALREIGANAFASCSNLSYVNNPKKSPEFEWMPKNLTYIGKQAFNNDKLLQGAVTIPSKVTELNDRTFTNTESISKLSFAEDSRLTSIGINVFEGMTISELKLPNSLSMIGKNAFRNMVNLKEITIPANVSVIGEAMFYGCSNLNTVIFEDGSKVTNLPRIYGDMKNLVLSDGLKKIESNALSYSKITSLQLPSTLLEISENAFKGSRELHSLDMTNVSFDNLIIGDNSFMELGDSNKRNSVIYLSSNDEIEKIKNANNGAAFFSCFAVTNGGTFLRNESFQDDVLAVPVKKGYIFKNWYDNENFSGNSVTIPESKKIYYAKWEEKKESTISFNDNLDKTYDGNAVSISEKDYTVTNGAGDVTFLYQVKEDNWSNIDSAPIYAGTYRVKAVVAENDNYKGTESDWKQFTIHKATPDYTLPNDLVIGKGNTLATVTLPNGFTWADETTIADELGTHEFDAIYTPDVYKRQIMESSKL